MTTLIDLFASALHFHPDGDVQATEHQMTTSDLMSTPVGGCRGRHPVQA